MTEAVPRTVRGLALGSLAGAFVLIIAGGLVTSRGAGLAVPDWPLSYGTLNPPRWWAIENVRTEHGHRLIAGLVGLLTLSLAAASHLQPCLQRVRNLTAAAAALVLVQAILGGLRVLRMSLDLAMVHAIVGQLYFVILALAAAATSPNAPRRALAWSPVAPATRALTAAVALQLVVGVIIRHLGARVRPLTASPLFYLHAALGLAILATMLRIRHRCRTLTVASQTTALAGLVAGQILLGVASWLVTESRVSDLPVSPWQAWLPTFHVATGAVLFALLATLAAPWAAGQSYRQSEPVTAGSGGRQ